MQPVVRVEQRPDLGAVLGLQYSIDTLPVASPLHLVLLASKHLAPEIQISQN